LSRRPIGALEAIPVATARRVGRERRRARDALALALGGEYDVARRFVEDPDSLCHEDVDQAIDGRLNAEARLGEWSR
jgi:hypothetical protein